MEREALERAYRAALDDAAKQLSYRALSAAALRDKLLKKGHSEDAADYALAWLTARRLLDDSRFAELAVSSYDRRGYGGLRIRQELRRRGVSRADADAALADHETDPATLRGLLDKKLRGDLSDPKAVQRTVAFLQRRGFSWAEIRRALHDYGAPQDDTLDDLAEE